MPPEDRNHHHGRAYRQGAEAPLFVDPESHRRHTEWHRLGRTCLRRRALQVQREDRREEEKGHFEATDTDSRPRRRPRRPRPQEVPRPWQAQRLQGRKDHPASWAGHPDGHNGLQRLPFLPRRTALPPRKRPRRHGQRGIPPEDGTHKQPLQGAGQAQRDRGGLPAALPRLLLRRASIHARGLDAEEDRSLPDEACGLREGIAPKGLLNGEEGGKEEGAEIPKPKIIP